MVIYIGSKLKTRTEYCRYNKECSFYGAAYCKELQWSNPEDCILYKLIVDVRELKNGSN